MSAKYSGTSTGWVITPTLVGNRARRTRYSAPCSKSVTGLAGNPASQVAVPVRNRSTATEMVCRGANAGATLLATGGAIDRVTVRAGAAGVALRSLAAFASAESTAGVAGGQPRRAPR